LIINEDKLSIVKAINDLYVLNRWKYLVLNKNGKYDTIQFFKNNPELNKNNTSPLIDWKIYHHINGLHTIGVFAGKKDGIEISKFITFDVDVKDKELAKWVVYKIVHVLQDIGIDDEFIHISSSGNKGYHVDLFFDIPIEVSLLKQFYEYVLKQENLLKEEINFGEVEFRPTLTQGVKIPLGLNFRNENKNTSNKCYFADYPNGLRHIIDPLYITKIKKIDTILFRLILDRIFDIETEETSIKNIVDYKYVKTNYTPLEIYKVNIDKDSTIKAIEELLTNGLIRNNTRHDSLLKIAKYYRYLGLSENDNQDFLIQWMQQQNKDFYTTKWEDVLLDIQEIIKYVYKNNCSLIGGVAKVEITYNEMKEILKAKSKNEKLTLYSMLIHSKRYGTKNGIFYMSYSLMTKATKLTRKTLIKIVTQLNEDKFINIIQRNKPIINNGKFMGSETNKYKITLNISNENNDKIFIVDKDDNCIDSFNQCLLDWYNKKEIKQLLGKRHYTEVISYSNSINT